MNSDTPSEPWLRRTQQFFAKKTSLVAASTALTAGIFAATLTYLQTDRTPPPASSIGLVVNTNKLPLETQNLRWGFFMDEYTLSEKALQRGDVLQHRGCAAA